MTAFWSIVSTREGRVAAAVCIALVLSGCARSSSWRYVDEPGVAATVTLTDGSRTSGTLISYDSGSLHLDQEITKSEKLVVVRRDGRDVALLSGVPLGDAVLVRDFDVVVRREFSVDSVEDVSISREGYIGWGTPIAALLAFLMIQLAEDI